MTPRRAAHAGLLALLGFALVELSAFGVCRFLAAKGIFYVTGTDDFERYLAIRDPVLGWPSPSQAEGRDQAGARRSVAFPDRTATPPAIACYGDSFTWGDEVSDAETWSERLALRIKARVDNFGVGGYGSDQALLRFRQKGRAGLDRARVVLLVHLSENIVRNLNQLRDLWTGAGGGLGFKPRFVLDGSDLRLVPLPTPDPRRLEEFARDPASLLRHETFLPGSTEGPVLLRFPFSASAARAGVHPRMRAALTRVPQYAHFYRADHPARGTELTAAILQAFEQDTSAAGRVGISVVLPTGLDLELFRRTGQWTYANLIAAARARGVDLLDVGPLLDTATRGRPLAPLFSGGDTGRHFSVAGNALIAELVEGFLRTRGLVASAGR